MGQDAQSGKTTGRMFGRMFATGRGDRQAESRERSRLEGFIDAIPSEYCGFALDGSAAYSEGFCRLLGIPSIRSLHDIQNALSPDDAAILEGLFNNLHREGHFFSITVRNGSGERVFRLCGRKGQDVSGANRFDILWLDDETETHRVMEKHEAGMDALQNERARLQTALDLMPSPIWMRDGRTALIWCNRAYAAALDSTQAAVIAEQKELSLKPVKKTGYPARQGGASLAQAALDSGGPEQTVATVIIEGKRRVLQITERLLSPNLLLGTVHDLTREEELELENRRYAAANNELLEQLGTAISIYDADQKLEFFNSAFAQLWNLDDTYLNGRPRLGDVMEKLREDRRLPEQADFRRFKQGWLNMFTGLMGPHEDMLYLPDSRALRMLVVPHPMGGLMMTFEDVSSRLALESSYNTLVAVQKETLDNLTEGVAVFGGDGRIKLWNPAFARLWHLHPEDLQGEPHISRLVERLTPSFAPESWPVTRERLLAQCLDRRAEKGRFDGLNGLSIDYSTVPLPDGGMLVTHIDVTDTARVENALRDKNAALEATERLKLDFLANVSYQLRTPLSAIVGFAEILANEYFGPLNERQKEYTDGMREAGDRLVALVNDILDLSTIEAGYLVLEKTDVAIKPVLAGLQDLTGEWARKEGIEVRLDCADDIGTVQADERRLKQVFLNLIRNAISFTASGGVITLSAKRQSDDIVALAVEDTGQGIATEDHERIFEPFERAQGRNSAPNKRGAGLGLTLVRNIVTLHKGTMTLDSEPGRGTKVTIFLPGKIKNP